MRRFRFSLEAVLRLKKQLEEMRQRELAAAQKERDLTLHKLGGFENDLTSVIGEHAEHRKSGVDVATEAWFQARHYGLSAQIYQAKRMLTSVRPRDIAGKTRRRTAAEELVS